jgi:hypothetical protein
VLYSELDAEMKTYFAEHKKEVIDLVKTMQSSQNRSNAPLKNTGSMLTGGIANVTHMLCDPGAAVSVAYPGEDPSALVRGNFTPFTSLDLYGGQSQVIGTPFGKFQVYKSKGGLVGSTTSIDPSAGLYKHPVLVKQAHSDGSVDSTLVFDIGGNGNQALFRAQLGGGSGFSITLNAQNGLEVYFPPEMVGGSVAVNTTNGNFAINAVQGADQYIMHATGFVPPVNQFPLDHQLDLGPTPVTINNITMTLPPESANKRPFLTRFNTFVQAGLPPQYVIPNGLETYDAVTVPQLQLMRTGGNDKGSSKLIAASILIGSDASAISNNGFIYSATVPAILSPPQYISFQDWISQQSRWFYKGRLATGDYQIYVPTELELAKEDPLLSSPWYGEEQYNMVSIIDNSFSLNGAQLPDKTQAHVTFESVISSKTLVNLIPGTVTIEHPAWNMALSLLRHYYNPCCNPSHKDEIVKWLTSVFGQLVNAGKDIITSPVTHELIGKAISTGIPLAMSLL